MLIMTRVEGVTIGPSEQLQQRFRALSDQTRLQIVEALRFRTRLTTAELIKVTGNRSLAHHLRTLEAAQIIRVVGEPDRTRTVWEEVPIGHRPQAAWDESMATDPEMTAAIRALERATTYRRISRMREFDDQVRDGEWGDDWADAAIGRDYQLQLTAQELEQLDKQLAELLERWKKISQAGGADRGETEHIYVTLAGFPVNLGSPR